MKSKEIPVFVVVRNISVKLSVKGVANKITAYTERNHCETEDYD